MGMPNNSDGQALLTDLLDLVREVLDQCGLEDLPRGAFLLARMVEGLEAIRGMALEADNPDALRIAEEARESLRVLVSPLGEGESAPGAALPAVTDAAVSDTEARMRTLNDAAARMMRCDVEDSEALRTIAESLRAHCGSPAGPDSAGQAAEQIAGLLEAIAEKRTADPRQDFAEAARMMDALTAALGDEAAAHEGAGPVDPLPAQAAPTAPAAEPQPASAGTTWALPPDSDPFLIADFVTECREYIQGSEAALLELENNPENVEAVNTVFRAFHTIKGTSGFLAITPLSQLAHKAENLLSRMRDAEIRCTGGYAELALTSLDAIKSLVEAVHACLNGGTFAMPENYDELMQILENPEKAGVSGETVEGDGLSVRLGDLVVAANLADRATVEEAAKQAKPIGQALVSADVVSVKDVARGRGGRFLGARAHRPPRPPDRHGGRAGDRPLDGRPGRRRGRRPQPRPGAQDQPQRQDRPRAAGSQHVDAHGPAQGGLRQDGAPGARPGAQGRAPDRVR
jgi:HPt (histidine-containing phosphotransfer) domain-containing protein